MANLEGRLRSPMTISILWLSANTQNSELRLQTSSNFCSSPRPLQHWAEMNWKGKCTNINWPHWGRYLMYYMPSSNFKRIQKAEVTFRGGGWDLPLNLELCFATGDVQLRLKILFFFLYIHICVKWDVFEVKERPQKSQTAFCWRKFPIRKNNIILADTFQPLVSIFAPCKYILTLDVLSGLSSTILPRFALDHTDRHKHPFKFQWSQIRPSVAPEEPHCWISMLLPPPFTARF